MAQNVHFQRLDDYQIAEASKRLHEIKAIEQEMAKIMKRSEWSKWEKQKNMFRNIIGGSNSKLEINIFGHCLSK